MILYIVKFQRMDSSEWFLRSCSICIRLSIPYTHTHRAHTNTHTDTHTEPCKSGFHCKTKSHHRRRQGFEPAAPPEVCGSWTVRSPQQTLVWLVRHTPSRDPRGPWAAPPDQSGFVVGASYGTVFSLRHDYPCCGFPITSHVDAGVHVRQVRGDMLCEPGRRGRVTRRWTVRTQPAGEWGRGLGRRETPQKHLPGVHTAENRGP